MTLLAFDIGGTHLRVGVFHQQRLTRHCSVRTSSTYAVGLRQMREAAASVLQGVRPDHVVIGIAGVIDAKQRTLAAAPNLHGWIGRPLVADARRIFRVPVRLINDATLAAIGEWQFGAGRGSRNCAYLAFGTGIGGTLLADGQPIGTANTEPGHQIIADQVTWESRCGGKSLQRRFGKQWKTWSQANWTWIADQVAVGLVNCTNLWSPDRIVLGGAISTQRALRIDVITRRLSQGLETLPTPRIVRGKLGDTAGLWGALALLKRG